MDLICMCKEDWEFCNCDFHHCPKHNKELKRPE